MSQYILDLSIFGGVGLFREENSRTDVNGDRRSELQVRCVGPPV